MISRRAKRVILGLAFGFLALVLFITLLNRYFAAVELRQRLEEERAEIREPTPLVHTVERETASRNRRFAARLDPWEDAGLAAEVAGRIEAFRVAPGDRVEAGEALVRLDDTLARLRLRTADAALVAARAQLREFERREREAEALVASRAVPESRLLEARAQVEVQEKETARLEAEVDQAREQWRRHEVRAPFAGVVGERRAQSGDAVTAYQPVIELAALDPLRVVFYAGEAETAFLEPGSEATLSLAGSDSPLSVEVRHVSPVAGRQTGTFRVEAHLPNPSLRYRAGLRGVIEVPIAVYENQLFIPATAVRYEGRQAYVDRLEGEGHAESLPVRVELGAEIRGAYPVLSGLAEGDRIVVK